MSYRCNCLSDWCVVEFSISDWYRNMSVPVGTLLLATQLAILNEALGITNYLLPSDQRCSRLSSAYRPETAGQPGWRIGQLNFNFISYACYINFK